MTQLAEIQITYFPRKPEANSRREVHRSIDSATYFREVWSDKINYIEEMYVMLLNTANQVLGYTKISMGGANTTIVDPKIVFQAALKAHATRIILGHNHPSGTTKPSQADIQLTKRLQECGNFLDIAVLDHIILGDETYFSFADDGLL